MKRVLSAVVFLPVFWLIVKKLKPGVYEGLIAVGALLALWELYRFAAARGQRCHRLLGALVALLIMASFAFRAVDIRYGLAVGLVILPLASLWRGGEWGPALADTGTSFFVATFIGVLFGYLIDLRTMSDVPKGLETGSDLVFLLFFVVWGSDTAAYFVGRTLGRRPLAPKVSPKKTVEGAIGGVFGALVAAFVARGWFMNRLTPGDCLFLGLALGTIGILGDLVESMLKRGAGLKDSASLVPGHGGILDRMDSLLYAGPVLYYYYLFAMKAH
jgi:phosphatidate cytidylyltransferase